MMFMAIIEPTSSSPMTTSVAPTLITATVRSPVLDWVIVWTIPWRPVMSRRRSWIPWMCWCQDLRRNSPALKPRMVSPSRVAVLKRPLPTPDWDCISAVFDCRVMAPMRPTRNTATMKPSTMNAMIGFSR